MRITCHSFIHDPASFKGCFKESGAAPEGRALLSPCSVPWCWGRGVQATGGNCPVQRALGSVSSPSPGVPSSEQGSWAHRAGGAKKEGVVSGQD